MKRGYYIALGLVLGALSFGFWDTIGRPDTSYREPLEALPELIPPETPVVVETIRKRDLVQRITSEGIFKALIETHVIAQVYGTVVRLSVEEGSYVREGDVLVEVDGESYRIAYLKAKDQVNRTLQEYSARALVDNHLAGSGRLKKEIASAVDSGNVNDLDALELASENSRKEWIASSTGLTQARLAMAEAKLNLDNTSIRAPFDAYVTAVEIGPNSTVVQGQELMLLVAVDYLTLEAKILESEIHLVRVGAAVSIKAQAFPDERFAGKIEAISPVVDAESGTCGIRIRVDNPQHLIKPGMFARVYVETRVFRKRLLVPRDALLIRDERKLVFVHETGLAKWRYVKTGLENNEFIEIKEGLNEGEELIVSGHFNLAHDASVVVVQR